MGLYFLGSHGRAFHTGNGSWTLFRAIAEDYGWKPGGTIPPANFDGGRWDGNYNSANGEEVSADDACALASALDHALRDVRFADRVTAVCYSLGFRDADAEGRISPKFWIDANNPKERAWLEHRLRDLATLCRDGSFKIW